MTATPPVGLRKILFPTDFSEPAGDAWAYAAYLAKLSGARLVLLHVVPPMSMVSEAHFSHQEIQRIRAEEERAAREKMAQLIAADAPDPAQAEAAVRHGTPNVEIAGMAREQGADLIVMGSHGRTGIGHALMGSVAEKVIRGAPCPVLVVRQPRG